MKVETATATELNRGNTNLVLKREKFQELHAS